MKNAKKVIASLVCAAALVGGFSISASAATSKDTAISVSKPSPGTYTTYGAGRW
ncbi:hypothetical protein [Priestia aryabhattai]|uniref:hypothetical protein n=1 Tax=Priestia aryabhattai TaxID=412384 RepID=UPI003CB106DB